MGDEIFGPRNEDEIDAIDDEVDTALELQIRKMRYEQQKYFEEKGVSRLIYYFCELKIKYVV